MFRNYVITAWRNLVNNKGFTVINILGLSIGIASFVLISLYVRHELSYDNYHKKGNRIYRIVENLKTDNEELFQSVSSPPMGPTLAREFPEVEAFVRMQDNGYLIRQGENKIPEDECLLVDSSVFKIFSWHLKQGDENTALTKPFSIVLTEPLAKKYFGETDPIGKVLEMDGEHYTVTGLMDEIPENSHFHFRMLVSFATFASRNHDAENEWFWNGFHTYLLLKDGSNPGQSLTAKMPGFIEKYIGKQARDYKMHYTALPLQPLASIYLETPRSWENGKRGSQSNLYILSIIAVFILLIACFNYVNLATARASRRVKEVGLRKVLGAERAVLVRQFLGESIIVCTIAMMAGIVISFLVLPRFSILVDTPMTLGIGQIQFWLQATGLTLVVGFLAGFYPALIASGFHPLEMFRKSTGAGFSRQWLRKSLVAFQFVISITLIAGTLLVFQQLHLMRTINLGFEKERTLVISYPGNSSINEHLESVKQQLKATPRVSAVSYSNIQLGQSTNNLSAAVEIKLGKLSQTNINTISIDHDFIPSYGIKMIAGRNFSRDFPADDTTGFIVNMAAVKNFGLTPEDALGRRFNQMGKKGKIIGVTEDFHYRSLHHKVEPLLIRMIPNWFHRLSVKIESGNTEAVVTAVEKKWKTIAPDLPFTYTFLDVDYNRLYNSEEQLGKIVSIFSGLAIFIACLGLVGLTSFSVERRVKEIGIRKVLGASPSGVVALISREFMQLLLISFVIAIPVTVYMIGLWLKNFTNQTAIGPVTFVIAGLSVLIVSLLVIGYLSFRAAMQNPVTALRTE